MANMAQAIRMALHYAEENLGVMDIFGEDVGPPLGGVFTATQGLKNVWNSPLDERGIIGTAIGLAMAGQRPVAEIQFADYIFNTIDLLKLAGNTCWASNGDWNLPMVVKTPVGSGIRGSLYHSHSFDATATHIPGWKIVIPSNPLDAYGLMISACQELNPVMFLEPKALLRVKGEERIPGEPDDDRQLSKMIDAPLGDRSAWKPQWPALEAYAVPIGQGKVVREGEHLTVVSYGRTLPLCAKAADTLREEGVSAEVIDLRSLWPYDWELIRRSIEKTGRVLFVNEDTEVTNFGEHLVRRTVEELFYKLMAPPRLLAGKFLPGIGLADTLEMASVPQLPDILQALRALATEQP
ncbi:alpha-ketoacid dehydrogenase subunit beta [Stigmatella aurantiaca]|uniref:2-oxoisovalerate dehydrogenase complex (E1 component), beta subunit n=2 Tax=Stigmatella aurantiaca (strain DW4/3-1) TaxID=378806 RepID=E3FE62_STIAD|nr:transketolase C-terminal domain-containing protein [Stigmatella aurantiaca]ADO72665.1 2-oxoisovalerate dehydrogenase complex (E1 component), beta subunit [Stigmatella aurantiaca DW4/3-1]